MLFNRPDQQFHVIAFDANGRVSGVAASITATLSIDGGAYDALNDLNPTEIGTTGEYVFDLLQAETNGYALSFVPVVASAGVEILGMPSNVIYTLDASTIAVNVLPAIGVVSDRSPGLTLKAFVGETILQAITLYEDDRVTPVDMSSKTLVIVFETRQGLDVATVASGDIAISGADDNIVTFAYPSAVTASERVLRFALRDAGSPNTVYLQGLLSVQRAPKVDAP
jgi:hypothetical protein